MAGIALTPSTRQVFEADLVAFETGKGTVRLQYGEPGPSDLLRRMIVGLVVEHERDGVPGCEMSRPDRSDGVSEWGLGSLTDSTRRPARGAAGRASPDSRVDLVCDNSPSSPPVVTSTKRTGSVIGPHECEVWEERVGVWHALGRVVASYRQRWGHAVCGGDRGGGGDRAREV